MTETVSEFLGRRSRELAERLGVLQVELDALSAELAIVERCLKAVDEPVAVEPVRFNEPVGLGLCINEKPEPVAVVPSVFLTAHPRPPLTGKVPYEPVSKGRGYSNLILKRLSGWMREYPAGPTVKEVAAKCKVSAAAIEAAFRDLRDRGCVIVYHGRKDNLLRVVPLGHVSPAEPDPDPEPVIPWIKHGPARALATERHKRLELPTYGEARDVSPLIFGDPPTGRSALDMKQAEIEAAARKDLNGQ